MKWYCLIMMSFVIIVEMLSAIYKEELNLRFMSLVYGCLLIPIFIYILNT